MEEAAVVGHGREGEEEEVGSGQPSGGDSTSHNKEDQNTMRGEEEEEEENSTQLRAVRSWMMESNMASCVSFPGDQLCSSVFCKEHKTAASNKMEVRSSQRTARGGVNEYISTCCYLMLSCTPSSRDTR